LAPDPKNADTNIKLPTDDPVKILVDFQSVHHAAFRLFTMAAAGGAWVLLKEGESDTTMIVPRDRLSYRLMYEFLYFSSPPTFNASIVFSQQGTTRGTVHVTADGTARYAKGEVVFT